MILCLLCWVFFSYFFCIFFFLNFYFKCSEPSRDSVGHFGLNSLPHTLSRSLWLPPSLSLLLSLKEEAFCDLQIEAGHVTPGRLSITARGQPTPRLKGTAPGLHRLGGGGGGDTTTSPRSGLLPSSGRGSTQKGWHRRAVRIREQLRWSFSL